MNNLNVTAPQPYSQQQMNMKNIPPNQELTTIQSMQSYINELLAYINENNTIYNRNLHKINQFYEEQINQLNCNIAEQEQEIIKLKNQVSQINTMLINYKQQLQQKQRELEAACGRQETMLSKYQKERSNKERAYEDVDRIRENMMVKITQLQQKVQVIDDEKAQFRKQCKEKESQIKRLKKEIQELEHKISQRYSMPEQIKSLEIQAAKEGTNIINLKQKLKEVQKNRDLQLLQLNKLRKENQKLRIQINKAKGDQSYEIQKSLKKERGRYMDQIQKLKLDNDRKVFQLKDIQDKLKDLIKEKEKLQIIVKGLEKTESQYKQQITGYKEDKQLYLDEFRNLKEQYERVIQNLQESIPDYQSKNWKLEQQNQELNIQLLGLQQLLRELKAMNDMQPFRKQYRQWAELHLAAQKKLPEQEKPQRTQQVKQDKFLIKRGDDDQLGPDWKRIMADIQNISV